MTNTNCSVAFWIAVVTFPVTSGLGCAALDGLGSRDCRELIGSKVVHVGGRVHAPKSINVQRQDLTLSRALAAAGGARDMVAVQANARFDPTATLVRRLVEASRAEGRTNTSIAAFTHFREKAIAIPADLKKKLEGESEDELKRQGAKLKEQCDTLIDDLATRLPRDKLGTLRTTARGVGKLETYLRFAEVPELREFLKETDEGGEDFSIETFKKETTDQHKAQLEAEANELENLQVTDQQSVVPSLPSTLLVSLDRADTKPPVRYWFPYELAANGLVGGVRLRGGDVVEVAGLKESGLRAASSAVDKPLVALLGAVTTEGIAEDFRTVGDVNRNVGKTISDANGSWTLVRKAADGSRFDIFVLPDAVVASTDVLASAPLTTGDVLTYTTVPQIPIVLESLVKTASARCGDRVHDRCQANWERHQDQKQTLHRNARGALATIGLQLPKR